MAVLILASAIRTCLGDGEQTFAALLRGQHGVSVLRGIEPARVNVGFAYHIAEDDPEATFRASRWLSACAREALDQSGLDCTHRRVVAIVGTGLRELRTLEQCDGSLESFVTERLHFGPVLREGLRDVLPGLRDVVTLANACSAGGHALAVAQDLLEQDEADVVIAAAADSTTESMLAMIGRFSVSPTPVVRPFDRARTGALLGEGAAALVVVREDGAASARARVLSTGLSCDAAHETAPDRHGIARAIADAFQRAGRAPSEVELVIAHATGTLLNDPVEASVLRDLFGDAQPLVTAIKGAIGHTSGAAALMSTDVAIRCMEHGIVPPVIGLSDRLDEGRDLRLVGPEPVRATVRLAQVNAFGFGGVNAITLLERVA